MLTRRTFAAILPAGFASVSLKRHVDDASTGAAMPKLTFMGRRGRIALVEHVPDVHIVDVEFRPDGIDPMWMAETFSNRLSTLCPKVAVSPPRGYNSSWEERILCSGFDPGFSVHWWANSKSSDMECIVNAGAEAVSRIIQEDAPKGAGFFMPECPFNQQSAMACKRNIPVRFVRYYNPVYDEFGARFDVLYRPQT